LRAVSWLSIDIEIDFINAGLRPGARPCPPCIVAQLNLTELLHSQAAPPSAVTAKPANGGHRKTGQ
jgi:hypothetical protein